MGNYEGKRILVTGGTSGIGLAVARLLTAGGARVMVTGRAADTEIEGVITVRSDATSRADNKALAARVGETFGRLDAVFLNAGITGSQTPFEEASEEDFDTVFAANAKGPYFTLQRLLPLLDQGCGVVLTTSVVNEIGLPNTSVYAASKAALRSMTRTLARELLPRGVRVNAVSPGPIDTGILHRSLPPEVADKLVAGFSASSPMRRMGEADEVARAAAFLAFDATYTTGLELAVDGGGTQL
ncbi:SDR family oxidoreductase [Symbioplanes lichenis]|uniref:SDR family oxidoreductase n=1 Tax=Symbioplanes lichenis TaxID=1629072 RepID=UPI0027384E93|nr:SDR family oxidoreductase [Actinoplanes lichenis]